MTKMDSIPAYLVKNVRMQTVPGSSPLTKDTVLQVYCNGEVDYRLRGVNIRTTAIWTYKDPATADDTYYSEMHGTRAKLVIRQRTPQQSEPVLYIEPVHDDAPYLKMLNQEMKILQAKYPGVGIMMAKKGWELTIPEKYKEGHEAHFARVTQNFLTYLSGNNMPAWEVPNMLAKYYTTTKALEIARHNK
jgi:hypothetical protein